MFARFNNNIYSAGIYRSQILDLGNLGGSFVNPNAEIYNQFVGNLKDQYIKVAAVTPTQLIPGCTITIPFTSYDLSFSGKNKFIAELSNANGAFTTPTVIGSTTSTASGSITAIIPKTLTYSSGYRIRIRSSDTLKTGYNYYAYADTQYMLTLICPVPSSGFSVTNITATTATLNWAAVACASGYKVQYRIKGTTKWTTVNIAGNTPTIGITGLAANTIYQWRVATKCKNNGTSSFSAFSSVKEFTTAAALAITSTIAETDLQTKASGITVYPNPATNTTIVQFNSSKASDYKVELTDVTGKVLQTITGKLSPGVNKVEIDVSKYAAGLYMVNVIENERKRALMLNKE